MRYDPIELMKLNITEADIQKHRDFILKALTESETETVIIPMGSFWLPFIIDMLTENEFSFNPNYLGGSLTIKIDVL